MEFAHVVPLGRRCRTTHNVHRFFGRKESFPFDWYILPLRGLNKILAAGLDVDRIYQPNRMEPVRKDGKIIHLENTRYGLWHVHCFPHEPGTDYITENWLEHLDKAKSRFNHTARRFKSLPKAEGPVLFVREGRPDDNAVELKRLKDHLSAFMGDAPHHLLLINCAADHVPDGAENIIFTERGSFGWRGDAEAWDKALASTGHRLVTA